MHYVVLLGRLFFSFLFIFGSLEHFTAADIASGASHGVPMPGFLVPFSGVIGILGGLSILLGYKARWGAWLLVIFLVPVTMMMHPFWSVDPSQMVEQRVLFLNNLSILGGALLIAYFGSGPLSLKRE